jgi:RNase P/RNase MRP subunit POP5
MQEAIRETLLHLRGDASAGASLASLRVRFAGASSGTLLIRCSRDLLPHALRALSCVLPSPPHRVLLTGAPSRAKRAALKLQRANSSTAPPSELSRLASVDP